MHALFVSSLEAWARIVCSVDHTALSSRDKQQFRRICGKSLPRVARTWLCLRPRPPASVQDARAESYKILRQRHFLHVGLSSSLIDSC